MRHEAKAEEKLFCFFCFFFLFKVNGSERDDRMALRGNTLWCLVASTGGYEYKDSMTISFVL